MISIQDLGRYRSKSWKPPEAGSPVFAPQTPGAPSAIAKGLGAYQEFLENTPILKDIYGGVKSAFESSQKAAEDLRTVPSSGGREAFKLRLDPLAFSVGALSPLEKSGELIFKYLAKEADPSLVQRVIRPMVEGLEKSEDDIVALAKKVATVTSPDKVRSEITDFVMESGLSRASQAVPRPAPADPTTRTVQGLTDETILSKIRPGAEKESLVSLRQTYGPNITKRLMEMGDENLLDVAMNPGGETIVKQRLALDDGALAAGKLLDVLSKGERVAGKQEAMRSVELGKRFGTAESAATEIGGEAGAKSALAKLRGELPVLEFEGLKGKITQEDINALFNAVSKTETLTSGGKMTARKALLEIFTGEGVPQRSGIEALRSVFGEEFAESITKNPGVLAGLSEILNVARALMASFDVSAPFRQGALLLVTKPKIGFANIPEMLKMFGSEEFYNLAMETVKKNPFYNLAKEAGISFTGVSGEALDMLAREEGFMTNLAEKIPLIGRGVRASERAYAGFLNKTRMEVYQAIAEEYIAGGILPKQSPKTFQDLAKFVNAASGRGSLGSAFNQATPLLNGIFFSPKFVASRIQAVSMIFDPRVSPQVRKTAAASFVKFVGAGLTILSLAKMGGAEVEDNPLSSDFGKIKFGKVRYDVWAGYQQLIRYTAQVIMGQAQTASGDSIKIDRLETAGRFIRSKLAPVPGIVTDLLAGTDMVGEPITLGKEALSKLVPIYLQDLVEAAEEYGAAGVVGVAIPGAFGIGTQVYESSGGGRSLRGSRIRDLSKYRTR